MRHNEADTAMDIAGDFSSAMCHNEADTAMDIAGDFSSAMRHNEADTHNNQTIPLRQLSSKHRDIEQIPILWQVSHIV